MRKIGVYRYLNRICIALALIAATILGSLPVTVQAASDPIDLELNAAGYTPIIVNNVKPGDSGVKTVELRNVGTKDGMIYIWLSSMTNTEGLNPESETGDTAGDGELGEYLLLDIDTTGLSTNMALPATVDNFPTSAVDQKYIKVIDLKVGETRILDWYWTLPADTGNMVQGDELSFTINYLLRETDVTGDPGNVPEKDEVYDITPAIDEGEEKEYTTLEVNLLDEKSAVEISEDGILKESVILTDADGMFTLELPGGTRIIGTGGILPGRIVLTIEEITIPLPDNTILLTPIYHLTGYDIEGKKMYTGFDPPVRLTIRYDPETIHENSFPPFIARYTDEDGLVPMELPVKFPVSLGRVDALVDGCSLFMALVEVAPPPPALPAYFTASNLLISPHEVFEGDPLRISVTITNEGSDDGTYELYLIVDGIVRAIQKVALSGKSSEILTFEIINLTAGIHQIKAAGLTETVRIEQVAIDQSGSGFNWMVLDLSVAGVVITGLLLWLLYMQRARRRAMEIGV
ncbi:MAG: hypothetical protein JSU58_10075 [Dehalococcoidales bacterium]|nr:MAG: hypothetical protein JSU58_10075 [Dehalococcoidales bacterium]